MSRLAILLFLSACAGSAGSSLPVEPSVLETPPRDHRFYYASWLSCYDGDTCDFIVHLGLSVRLRQRVRFYGIDTPELRGPSRERGIEVRDFVIDVLEAAHKIVLAVPQRRNCGKLEECDERGRYGRLLANVMVDDRSLNNLLINNGMAELY